MASVTLKNISKVYDNKIKVVSDFSLEIADKEFVVFVGPSGCGKSTTLRMISGLEKITGGELFIGETMVNTLAPKDRDIAMVFQNYALYPHMTVYENMAFGLKVKKTPKDEIDRRVQEAAQILDITQYLDRRPKALSGGQRQRVAIGRAIVRHPQVFLMDEPLSNLDAKLRTLMRTEILKLHRRLQTTMIYVTHDQVEAMTLGDRIVVMKDGIIQQVDTPHNIFENPCNMFVAGFIGSPQMNFLSGKLSAVNGQYRVEIAGKTFDLPAAVSQRLAGKKTEGQDLTVGIRPEYLELCAAGEGLTLELDVAELIGSEFYMHANLGEQRVILKVSSDLDVKRMTTIHCRPKEGKIHLFSTEDGCSLTL